MPRAVRWAAVLVMGVGRVNFTATARERKIDKLDSDLLAIDFQKWKAAGFSGNEAEARFEAWVKDRHGHSICRAGWPDYLLEDKTTGRPFAVEVKNGSDRISKSQAKCFSVMEKGGISVHIWNPRNPKKLVPWRKFLKATGYRADKIPAKQSE